MTLKQIGICIAVIAAITMSAASQHYYKAYKEQKALSAKFEATISDMGREITQTKIKMNDTLELYQATVEQLTFSKKNLEARYGELLKASDLRSKDVNSLSGISTKAHSIDTVVALVDTFGGIKASLNDRWASIDVEVKPDRNTIIEYTFKDSITVVNVQKKHSLLFGLIKWKSLEKTSVVSHNPKAQITGLQTINVIE